jgi:hypothetical protein
MANPKWEYQTDLVTGEEHLDMMLKTRGEQSWELVAMLPKKRIGPPAIGSPGNEDSWTLVFKQPAKTSPG